MSTVVRVHRLACVAAAAALVGCATLGGPPAEPRIDVPGAFSEPGPTDQVPLAPDWWQAYGAQELSALIRQALESAPDLAIAAARVREAEAQARIAGASLFPALSASVSSDRTATRSRGDADWFSSDLTRAGLSASYELDFWGKNASSARAGQLGLAATRFDAETVRLTLVAGVASAYFQILSSRGRIAIARDNLAIAERVLSLVNTRAKFGSASALDVARQQTAVLTQRAAIPPLEQQERQTAAALAVLIGRVPESFEVAGARVAEIPVPGVAPGLPSEILVRRPDLAGSEATLAAAHANVAAARAALLPSIELTGSAGLASAQLLALGSPTKALSIGLSVLQPIFDGGRLRGELQLTQGREQELLETYRKAILSALADVENALVAANRSREQESLQAQVRERAQRALGLAELRYKEGADDLLVVLDAQRTLFQAEDQFAQVRLARLQASVSLFKALGGGWEVPRAQAR